MIGVILLLTALLVSGLLSNAASVLTVSFIVSLLAYKFPNLYKKATYFYIVALLISMTGIYFYLEPWVYIVNKGLIGFGFIYVVMMAGVLPNKWGISRAIKKNRGVFSILGFIFITPHASIRVLGLWGTVNIFGIAAYVIMIPLTIISFRVIRKQINPKDWFTIQKAAYGIYVLVFTHLLFMDFVLPENKIVYAVMTVLYINNKLIKEYFKHENRRKVHIR